MPNYKNQLTQSIIKNSFTKQSDIIKQPFVEIQLLYTTLCKMVKQNSSHSASSAKRQQIKFDRQVYEQILEESELIKIGDSILVKMLVFCINLMRAEIALNQKLKIIKSDSGEIQAQIRQIKTGVLKHLDGKYQQRELQKLEERFEQLYNQKIQNQQILFFLRLAFINQKQLSILTQKLQLGNEQTQLLANHQKDYKPVLLQQQKGDHLEHSSLNHLMLKLILWTVIFLFLCEGVIVVFYKNHFLNILALGFVFSMFFRRFYSKAAIKFFLIISLWSIVVQIVFLILNLKNILHMQGVNLIQVHKPQNALIHFGKFTLFIWIMIIIIMFGKLILSIFLAIELCQKQQKLYLINFFGTSLILENVGQNPQRDLLSDRLRKIFQ